MILAFCRLGPGVLLFALVLLLSVATLPGSAAQAPAETSLKKDAILLSIFLKHEFRTEFYATYDYKPIWEEEIKKMAEK